MVLRQSYRFQLTMNGFEMPRSPDLDTEVLVFTFIKQPHCSALSITAILHCIEVLSAEAFLIIVPHDSLLLLLYFQSVSWRLYAHPL